MRPVRPWMLHPRPLQPRDRPSNPPAAAASRMFQFEEDVGSGEIFFSPLALVFVSPCSIKISPLHSP